MKLTRILAANIAFLLFASLGLTQTDSMPAVQLMASDASPQDYFGSSVAMYGDRLVVGAAGRDQVYIFDRIPGAGWVEQARLYTGIEVKSVDVHGDRVVVGSFLNDAVVQIYRNAGCVWTLEQTLYSQSADLSSVGNAVAIEGDHLVVGDTANYDGPEWAGSAYMYGFDGDVWNLQASVTDPYEYYDVSAMFGYSVDISGDRVWIGAPGGNPWGYVKGWYPDLGAEFRLTPSVPVGRFGESAALNRRLIAVGAPDSKRAFIYRKNGTSWEEITVLSGPETFGTSIAVQDPHVAVGAPGSRTSNVCGAVYVYFFPELESVRDPFGPNIDLSPSRLADSR